MKIKSEWVLAKGIDELIAEEVDVPVHNARSVAKLFEDQNEVAYVARYCQNAHGGMTCDQLRKANTAYSDFVELNKKATNAIKSVIPKIETKHEKVEVERMIKSCTDVSEIAEISKMYSSPGSKITKAGKAKELGFERAALMILEGKNVNLNEFKSKEVKSLKEAAEHVKNLIADIMSKGEVAEVVSKIAKGELSAGLMVTSDLSTSSKKLQKADEKRFTRELAHFKKYVQFRRDVKSVLNYQILALSRAEEKGLITWKIEVDEKNVERLHPKRDLRIHPNHSQLFKEAFNQTVIKQFIPKIQRFVKKQLRARAEESAIGCFARNLRSLFNMKSIPTSHVIALDPGYSACKAAFLSPNGSVIATQQFKLNGERLDQTGGKLLSQWAARANGGSLLVAIGNGKASNETQKAVAEWIRCEKSNTNIHFCVVSESGASKYSITELAEQDLPGMPPTERSAVSLGRRLIDPMGELVKVEPKHLGVGMYQHSVNDAKLTKALDEVVTECVSMRGVDVNKASVHLLRHVCGLTKATAQGIIDLREKKGRIQSREELKTVKGVGEKSYRQCAGFLIVNDPLSDSNDASTSDSQPPKKKKKVETTWNRLDATIVHPEQYTIAEGILRTLQLSNVDELSSSNLSSKSWTQEQQEVLDLLKTEVKLVPHPQFLKQVREIRSLKVGEIFHGTVTNVTEFGAFIDIGVGHNGLVHRLKIGDVEVGTMVVVRVMSVNLQLKRIELSHISGV